MGLSQRRNWKHKLAMTGVSNWDITARSPKGGSNIVVGQKLDADVIGMENILYTKIRSEDVPLPCDCKNIHDIYGAADTLQQKVYTGP